MSIYILYAIMKTMCPPGYTITTMALLQLIHLGT